MPVYPTFVRKLTAACILGLLTFGATSSAQAVILFEEHFNTDVANLATFNATYPAFTTAGGVTSAQVSGGVLMAGGSGGITIPGYNQDIVITGDVGAVNSNGSYNVGITIGGRNFVFHPGFVGPPVGAFRIEGGNAPHSSNTSMGYIPANGTLHHVEIRQIPSTGEFRVKITDGNNPSNVFTTSDFIPAAVGGTIGFQLGSVPALQGLFDNLVVETSAQLEVTPVANSLLSLPASFGVGLLPDAITLKNTGLDDSTIDILSFNVTGPDAAFFTLPDFLPTTLTAGGLDTVSFDLGLAGTEQRLYTAGLTIVTSLGNVSFDLQATFVPEPSSLMLLGLGTIFVARRRRRNARPSFPAQSAGMHPATT